MNDLFQTGLINRNFAALQGFDFGRVIINTQNIMADVSEARAGDKPDITGTDDGKIHDKRELRKLAEGG
jgi:hypothetical protein